MSEGIWRDGKTLVMTKEAFLPDRCLRCNAPANGYRLRRRLRWHHPALYILIFGAMLFYLILALALSKRATVDFALCMDHVRRRRNLMLSGWGVFLLALTLLVVAFSYDYAIIGLSAALLLFVAIIWLVIAYRVVAVKRIDDRYIWLRDLTNSIATVSPLRPAALSILNRRQSIRSVWKLGIKKFCSTTNRLILFVGRHSRQCLLSHEISPSR
jgi:hypothetical protein